jgi:hypothetical protein
MNTGKLRHVETKKQNVYSNPGTVGEVKGMGSVSLKKTAVSVILEKGTEKRHVFYNQTG